MIFQGKPWSEDNREHLVIELGDAIWYIANACMALEVSFDEVVKLNVEKLRRDILVDSLMFNSLKIEKKEIDEIN